MIGGSGAAGGVGSSAITASAGKMAAAGAGIGNWALGALSSISSRLISSQAAAAAGTAPPQHSQQKPTTVAGTSTYFVNEETLASRLYVYKVDVAILTPGKACEQ